jgi:L-amino acid N-acyltransferase YncA
MERAMVTIRSLRASDLDAVQRIDHAIQREYRGADWDALSQEAQARLLWYPGDTGLEAATEFSFVALDGEEVVGFVIACREPIAGNRRLYADGVAVLPEYRRAGVAAALYGELITTAKAAGVDQIKTRISTDNPPSLRLHASVGFNLIECVEATLEL